MAMTFECDRCTELRSDVRFYEKLDELLCEECAELELEAVGHYEPTHD